MTAIGRTRHTGILPVLPEAGALIESLVVVARDPMSVDCGLSEWNVLRRAWL